MQNFFHSQCGVHSCASFLNKQWMLVCVFLFSTWFLKQEYLCPIWLNCNKRIVLKIWILFSAQLLPMQISVIERMACAPKYCSFSIYVTEPIG